MPLKVFSKLFFKNSRLLKYNYYICSNETKKEKKMKNYEYLKLLLELEAVMKSNGKSDILYQIQKDIDKVSEKILKDKN